VQGVFFEDLPIQHANLSADGEEVLVSGRYFFLKLFFEDLPIQHGNFSADGEEVRVSGRYK
jgi:hypothetical protein